MAKIGNWGRYLKFQTDDSRILNFDGLRRKVSARVGKHNLISRRPVLEYLGPDLQSITFKIELNAMVGVRPRKEEEKLMKKIGYVAPLVIGGKKICSKAMLTGVGSAYNIVLGKGEVLSISLDVTMTEC